MSVTPEEYSELQIKSNQVLAKLEELDISEWQKKKDLIEEFVNINRLLLEGGKLTIPDKKSFCSYIVSKLTERNITVNRNGNFYRLFASDEKGDNAGIQELDLKSNKISSGVGKTTDELFRDKVFSKPPKDNEYTKFFGVIDKCIQEADTLNKSLLEKYNESDELADVIEATYDLAVLNKKYVEIHAVLKLARENIDDRNKWSNYEKLIAQFLIAVGETKAELAKKLKYCSKYASIGIERSEELIKYWEYLGKCPNCKTNIKDKINLEIQHYKSGEELGIDTPLTGY